MAIDRNQKARDEFAIARARKQFQDAVASGQASLRDRLGRPLKVGDSVLVSPNVPPIMRVASVGPVLDPSVPPGYLKMELTVTIPFMEQANKSIANMVKIGEAVVPAAGEVPATNVAEPPAEPPTDRQEGDPPSEESPTIPDAPTAYDTPPTTEDEHGPDS